jgi:hypothetical protein
MRHIHLLTLGLLLTGLCFAATASAETIGVGNCQKSGACAAVCVDVTTPCSRDGAIACAGISLEVPFCLPPLPPMT